MKLLAKYHPDAPLSQRWTWALTGHNGKHVNGSYPEGFSTVAKMRQNAKRTGDGIWAHMNPLKGRIIFDNESDLAAMGKKAKDGARATAFACMIPTIVNALSKKAQRTMGTGEIQPGDRVKIGDDKTIYRAGKMKGDLLPVKPVQKPAKKAKGGTIREGDIITFGGPTKIGRKTYPAGTKFRAGKDESEPAKKAKGAK